MQKLTQEQVVKRTDGQTGTTPNTFTLQTGIKYLELDSYNLE